MFFHIFSQEFVGALKKPMVYIFLLIVALLVFGATVSESVVIGESSALVTKNAPHVITNYTIIMTLFGLMMATAFFNSSALKDYENQFHEIIFSTPISKASYFFGRFFAAFVLSTIPLLGVFLGLYVGCAIGPSFDWIQTDQVGPFRWTPIIGNFLLFIIPNMFIAGTFIYAAASIWKNTIISFIATLSVIVLYIISGTLISNLDNESLASLLDMFGIRSYFTVSKYFTPFEKNNIFPGFHPSLLLNRFVWISIGSIILGVSYRLFSFTTPSKKSKKVKNPKRTEQVQPLLDNPQIQPLFNSRNSWIQLKSFTIHHLSYVFRSVTFKIVLLFGMILLFSNLYNGFEFAGHKSYPVTYKVLDTITVFSKLFTLIILVFFCGELVWKDKQYHISEIIDSTPHNNISNIIGKFIALVTAATFIHAAFVIYGIIYQLINGYYTIEIDLYIKDLLLTSLPTFITWTGIMLLIQTLVKNKYIGYFLSILLIFFLSMILAAFDISSYLVKIGSGPSIIYSDMNGFGPNLVARTWFDIYWVLFTVVCLFVANYLWRRGTNRTNLLFRIKNIRSQVDRFPTILVICCISWILCGGFIYYNTHVLNSYLDEDESDMVYVKLEKEYSKYANLPQPKIIEVKYDIDIFPNKRIVNTSAIITLENKSSEPIKEIHFITITKDSTSINIKNAIIKSHDKELGYLIYTLNAPMSPNSKRTIQVNTKKSTTGFENTTSGAGYFRVKNGTFLNNNQLLPRIGYSHSFEIVDKQKRKKYKLPVKEDWAKLEKNCTSNCSNNYLSDGESDFVNVETTISTSSDQTAIAPGSLVKQWKKDTRNYYHYKVDHASINFYSFISAKYEIKRRTWKGIDLEVYYHKKHDVNVEYMLDAMERSLVYYTKNFGPYYHKQCRIIEFPRYQTFAQAFPGTMPYSESMGFITNIEDEDVTVIDNVIAHEIAHQWWAHQVMGAKMQGATMLSESFAEYSSLMVSKNFFQDPIKLRDYVKFNHARYLRGRSQETEKESPLLFIEDQGYIHYGKGAIVLYAIQEYIGEQKLNNALKNFLDEFKHQYEPYPTSLDFLKHLKKEIPDSLSYLIKDLFYDITLFDNRVLSVDYKKTNDDKYKIDIQLLTQKFKSDSIGKETKTKINDWIDISFYKDEDETELINTKRIYFDTDTTQLTFTLDSLPYKAIIDPKRMLIDKIFTDNSKELNEL